MAVLGWETLSREPVDLGKLDLALDMGRSLPKCEVVDAMRALYSLPSFQPGVQGQPAVR